ncbi:MAG: glycosyltransferase family 1 protein [Vicinamibacterales bacterium]
MVPFANVRVLVDYRPALRARTGIGEYVHELTRALAAAPPAGSTVTAFSSSWRDRVDETLGQAAPGVRVIDRRVPVRALTWAWHRLAWPPVEAFAGDVDVVHSPTPLRVPARRAAQVVTVFDLHFLAEPDAGADAVRRDFVALARRHVTTADHVIAGSAYAAGLVATTLGVPPEKVTTTPLGAPAWAAGVRSMRGQAPGRTLLVIGTLEPRKNLGLVLDAYARLRERRADAPPLVVAGRVAAGGAAWADRAARPPLIGHVKMMGYVDDATRLRLYADARAVLVPSLDEGFGLPALEAMACGVPVVVSPAGALPEVVGTAGIVAPLDAPEAWADAIEGLLDEARAGALGARGLVRAAGFSWATTAAATWNAYRLAMAARAERA